MKKIEGICPLIAMPYDKTGKVQYEQMNELLDYMIGSGVHGIGLFGVVSEFYKLTDEERMNLAELFTGKLKPTPVFSLVSVTDHATEVAVERAKAFEKMGADCLMVLPPHFLKPTIDQIMDHLERVVSAVKIPVMVQYAPNETGMEISTEKLVSISEKYANTVYKIENNPPIEYSKAILKMNSNLTIMNGYWGLYFLDILDVGGKGVMPGPSFCEIYVRMYNLYKDGRKSEARELHRKLMSYIDGRWHYEMEKMIAIEKEILRIRGALKEAGHRCPAYFLKEKDHQDIQDFLKEFSELLPVVK